VNDMKATGIIRRIDDLGRIVIPKDIRRILRIHENDPMEIFVSEDGIILKKYNYIQSVSNSINDLKEAIDNEDNIKNKSTLNQKIKELEEILKVEQENTL